MYELEELYAARDSRPEDLDMIAQLQWAVNERDESIQRLSVREKKRNPVVERTTITACLGRETSI